MRQNSAGMAVYTIGESDSDSKDSSDDEECIAPDFANAYKYILTVKDVYSKKAWAFAMKTKSSP